MVKYAYMKFAASVLVALLVHASAFAGARVVVPQLPPSPYDPSEDWAKPGCQSGDYYGPPKGK